MIKAILVDDEPRGLSSLQKMLEQNCHNVMIQQACSDAESAMRAIEQLKPELVFLDISMPGKNAFDMLNEMKPIRFEIIFVTAHDEYSLQAFRYSAVDYLMKPVDEDALVEAVERAKERIRNRTSYGQIEALLYNLEKVHHPDEMKLCIPAMKGFHVLNISDIIYCEAESSYTIFHLTNGQNLVASKSIIEYELLLQDTTFCRIHKSYLVNLSHVTQYQKGEGGIVVLSNKMEVEVSRRKKDQFISKMKSLYRF